MAWLGRRQKWRDCEVGMALTVFLLLPLYILSLTTTSPAQQLKLWVWHTSVEKEQSKPDPRHREPYFQVNHSLQMICKYADDDGTDYCALRGETNLTMTPVEVGGRENQLLVLQNLVIVEKTKCHLIIELQNVTTAFQGRYYCNDSLNPGQFTHRDFHVGEAPVAPRDLRVVFQPSANFSLLLDPVRTGQDLNDPDTTWNIQYEWQLTPEGQCQACVVPLQYRECGQYANGFLDMWVNFNWTVENKFGSVVGKTPADVMITDWVKPGPPSHLEVANESTTSSTLAVTVSVPAHLDQAHISYMKGANRLQLQYSVEILSARDQILLSPDGARFMQEYDFVPNLQDEEEALRDSLLQSNFSGLSELLMWNSSAVFCNPTPPAPLTVGISPLPFAGYHYNVLFIAKGHYWGTPVHFEREKAVTKDGVPLEGPGLHHNFAYCRPPDTSGCVTCIVYFKAIPQTKRGGEVIQHRLDVNLSTNLTSDLPQACANRNGVTITTRGSNNTSNTFRVPQLALGGVYEVRVQASTSAGHSPVTSGTLHVASSPADFAPWNVVMESKDPSYTVEWKPGKTRAGNSAVFYVHYCYTLLLQLDSSTGVSANGSVEPPLPLNCVTNMVTKTMARDSRPAFTFRLNHTNKGLTPAFFVSAVGPQGVGSGLQAVDCFYTSGMYPEAVDPIIAQQVEGDPGSLLIRFKLPCGPDQSYIYGRPYSYAVGKAPLDSDCEADCGKVMTGRADLTQQQINGSLRDEVTFTLPQLLLDSRYCVGVNVMDQSQILRKSSWRCVVASTGKEEGSLSGWLVSVVVVISVLVVLVISIMVYCKIRAQCHKYTEKFKDSYYETGEAQGSGVSNMKWEGLENRMFHGDCSQLTFQVEDGEVHVQDETPQPNNSASTVEDWPEEREPATSSTQSTLTHSQSSGEDEDSQHAPMSHHDYDREDTASLTASTHSQPTHDATVHPDVSGGETSERPYPVLQPLDTGGKLSDRYSSVPSGGHNSHQIELAVMDAERPDPEEEDGEGEEGSVSGSEEEEGSEQAEDVGGREEAMEQAAVSSGSVNQSPGVAHRGAAGRDSLSPLTGPTGVLPDADPSTAIDIDDILLSALGPDTAKPGSPLMVSSALSVVSSPAALSVRREEPVGPAGRAEPAMPPVLFHPQLSTQTASQSGDVEDSGTHTADSPTSCHPAPSSSDMNIDAILQSAEESRPGAFPLSHSTVVVGGSGDLENLSPSHPHPQQPFHGDSFPPVNGIDVGRDDGDFSDSRTVPQLPLAQSPGQSPNTLPHFQDGVSALSSAPESSPQVAGSDPLDLDTILSAASNCPWDQLELTPSPDVERSRKAFQDKRYDNSLHLARQESGIHMDKGLGSSTESGLEQLPMVLSGSGFSLGNGSSEDEKSLLSPTDSSHSSSEGGEDESLLESSFLPPTDKTSRAGKVTVADGPSLMTTRV